MDNVPQRKGWFRNQSITTKFSIVLVLTALLPLILLSGYNLYNHATDILERSLDDLERLSVSNADLIARLIEDTDGSLHILANDPEVVDYLSNPANVSSDTFLSAEEAFQNTLDSNPLYEYVYLIDADGNVLISKQLDGLASVKGRNFGNRDYFIQGMLGNEYIDVLVGRISGKMGFYFSAPVIDENGNTLGVTILKLQGDGITGIINDLNSGGTDMSAILIDQDGIVVSPPRDYEEWMFQSITELSPETLEKVKARFVRDEIPSIDFPALVEMVGVTQSGSFHTIPGENPLAVGYAPIDQLGWIVGINIPPQVLIERIVGQATVMLISGFILSLIAVVIAVVVARSITRPISKLAVAAQNIEEEKPFDPKDIADVMSQGDELGHLARVFSAMVLALRARMADLETIYEIGQEISGSVDLEETLHYILAAINRVIPYDAAELCFYDSQNDTMIIRAAGIASGYYCFQPETANFYDLDEGYISHLQKTGRSLLVADVQSYTKHQIHSTRKWNDLQPHSYLGVPLHIKDQVIGTLELISEKAHHFSEDNRRLLESIAAQAAIEVQNAQDVLEREQRLAQQIQQMDISIDREKQADQVESIVASGFFKLVKQKSQEARKDE